MGNRVNSCPGERAMPSRKIACCIVVALLAVDACGADKDLEQQLNDKYKGRAFILQHFYRGGNLHYSDARRV